MTVKRVPVLNASYPADASVSVTKPATFTVSVAEDGYPDNYTYQWYVDGKAVSGATDPSYTMSRPTEGTATVYCEVTNSVGTVTSRTATFTANRIYLYNKGDTCSAVTGGWVAAKSNTSSDSYSNCLTFNSDSMAITSRANQYDGGCGTAWALDLSKHTRLNAITNTDGNSDMYVSSQLNDFNAYIKAATPVGNWETVSLDISHVDSGHIAFLVGGDITRATNIHSVWLG